MTGVNSFPRWRGFCDTRLRGNDGNKAGNDWSQPIPTLGRVLRQPLLVGEAGQLRQCGKVCENSKALSNHKSNFHSGQKTCDLTVVGQDGQQRPCRMVCKNAKEMSNHKIRDHSAPRTCDVRVVGKNGQLRPCGKFCKNARVLSNHKRIHRKRKATDVEQDNVLSP
ncbi:hypothetical protein [Endozoicomonas sp. 8E]|uniref:hypothetical protein n=1 Tax=Endozoicomonas sp. 8E TaxID=3035692 RepID=UPI002938EE62|nr:hypothetical protein [Endozoicomonas sp. 8E]WOG28704.1 hypothetical protein P6910_03325 [Endozoicomonas sp. 8E]